MANEKKRQSGIELLRILTALFVVMLHYNDGRAFTYAAPGSAQKYILFGIESIGICAVDLFILISGYFLSTSQRRSVLKPLELLVQVSVFSEANYIIRTLLAGSSLDIVDMIACAIPNNYFAILYAALYLISPYINTIFKNLTNKKWDRLVVTLLLLFSVWPVLVDFSEEILNKEWFGFSTVTAWGSQQGFNIVNFTLMYVVGAYLRHREIPEAFKKMRILLPTWLITVAIIFGWSLVTENLPRTELRSAWVYHNPMVILSAVLLFCMFSKLDFSSKIINRLAVASFTSFIFHVKIMDAFDIEAAVHAGTGAMLGHMVLVVLGCYLMAWIAHEIYHFAADWVFKKLSRLPIFANKEII